MYAFASICHCASVKKKNYTKFEFINSNFLSYRNFPPNPISVIWLHLVGDLPKGDYFLLFIKSKSV